MRQTAFAMVGMARQRGCTVIVAGSDATDHAQAYFSAGADYVLIGEGEQTLGELVDHLLRDGPPLDEILGLGFKRGDEVVINARRPDLKELDAMPFPAWDLVDIQRYQAIWYERQGYYSMNLATSRGCPYHCNWCAKPIWGQRYHVRSPENVAAELAWLKRAFKPDHVWFVDDIFGLIPGWMERFADLVEAQDARLPFKSLQRVDLILKGDTIDALRRAGAQRIWMGAESGSQKILDAMEKGTQVENIYEAAQRLHEAGIEVGFFLQFGYPGETRTDIDKTLQMVRDCKPDDIGMSVSYPLPGTKFHETVKQELGDKQHWVDSNDLDMLYHGPFTTDFYRQLPVGLHKEFGMRRGWDGVCRAVRQPTTLKRRHLRRLGAVAFYLATLPLARRRL